MNAKDSLFAKVTTQVSPLFAHQKHTLSVHKRSPIVFDTSDPGTGKTRVQIEAFAARRRKKGGKALVIATKSLLDAAWAQDFRKFAPDMEVGLAFAHNREKALASEFDVIVTNHDAVKTLPKPTDKYWKQFDTIIIDECFPAGTLVDTPCGQIPIEMLKCGDLVYTSSGIAPVSDTFIKESTDLVQMELSDGTQITCTANHPFATEYGWMEARSTRNMSVVRLNIHQLNQQGSDLLQPQLRTQSNVGVKDTSRTQSNSQQISKEITRSHQLEQRNPLPTRNQSETQCMSQSLWASTKDTWWEWKNFSLRKNDARNAPSILGRTIHSDYWKRTWQRLSISLQARLRLTFQKMGIGSRRKFTHIAQTLGCEERFLAGTTRVVSVSRVQCTSPRLVFNLQINGPHDYSVAGILVHNCTAFKHHTSARSKALAKLSKVFKYRSCLTGTPTSNGICDIWHQVFILDGGERLGKSFFAFRSAACIPEQVGPQANMLKWVDRPGVENIVADTIADITVRHKFEDCVDIPPNHRYSVSFTLSKSHLEKYRRMENDKYLELRETGVTAVNGAVVYQKLLQIASGAVYDDSGTYTLMDTARYSLILDMVEERKHSIVFFNWEHQRDELVREAEKRGISYGVFDGKTSNKHRSELVTAYQKGKYQVLFAHPQSAGHGLTLTRGTATIWASPTYNLEHFLQGLKRIHRIGQTEKTETIVVIAENTIDEKVWAVCQAKDAKQGDLLNILKKDVK